MKWTDVQPSKPGWYWFRSNATRYHIRECVVEIVDYPGETPQQWTVRGADINWSLGNLHGQWSDAPIPEPKEG